MAADLDARIRTIIIECHNEGMIPAQIAKTLKLPDNSVRRIIKLFKETGSIEPRPRAYGPKPLISDEKLDEAVGLLAENPNMPIKDLIEKLNLNVSQTTMRNALKKRRGFSYKKKLPGAPGAWTRMYSKSAQK